MSDPALNLPVLRKKIPICVAVGEFKNGPEMKGVLNLAYFQSLIANQKKQPRQIPIYLLTGQPEPEHPEDLDARYADGWVEGLSIEGDKLMADAKLHGDAAVAVANDFVRGDSIGTVQGKTYTGIPMGDVLAHVVLTNKPYVKGMNVALSRAKGGEPVSYHFTALKEADMADEKNDAGASGKDGGNPEVLNLTEKLTAAEILLTEKEAAIRELTASRDNLLAEVKAFRESPQLDLALKERDQARRINTAYRVRFLTDRMARDGQIGMEALRGWYDHDSDEVVLAGFKNSQFKGDLNLLEYHRASVTKRPVRNFSSGATAEAGSEFTADDKKSIEALGKDPEQLAATRGSSNFTEWQRRKKAAGKEK